MEPLNHTTLHHQTNIAPLYEKFGLRPCMGTGPITLYRSRELSQATQEDATRLENLGIRTVYDLRKATERERLPESPFICDKFNIRTCPVDLQNDESRTHTTMADNIIAAYGQPGKRMEHLYRTMATHADTIHSIVYDIVTSNTPVLVHCANGKDRAGIICASVQKMLGASYQEILDDYLVTNHCNEEMNRCDLARYAGFMQPDELDVLAAMFEARPSYLNTFFASIDARYGSFKQWITSSDSPNSLQ